MLFLTQACKESCLAFNQRKECKCREYRFPIPQNVTPVCDIFDKKVGEYSRYSIKHPGAEAEGNAFILETLQSVKFA